MTEREKLFDQFPPVSTKQWMDKITADLKGVDFNKKLVWRPGCGFEVQPFYRHEDLEGMSSFTMIPGEYPYLRGGSANGNRWLIRQNITVDDYRQANLKALDILMKGVDSIGFILADPQSVTQENFRILLEGIQTDAIEINFLSGGKAREIAGYFEAIVNEQKADPTEIRGTIEADPLGRLMLNGTLCIDIPSGLDYLAGLAGSMPRLPNMRTIQVNASHFCNAGADLVTELAFGLSEGNEYINILRDRAMDASRAASSIKFSFGIGSNYFFEIAKLRAARLLWSMITEKHGIADRKASRMEIHCVTSEWNKTFYDPHVNMLRTQTEAMSATLGGTDSLTVEPFDKTYAVPGEFSERIARNQQLLLREEAFFDKVADPAGGSYYIEKLTSLIAEHSWKLFLEVEETGGFLEGLRKGFIQKKIKEVSNARVANVASRREILLGTNQFPNFSEVKTSPAKESLKGPTGDSDLVVEPVRMFRGAEIIESLRMAAGDEQSRPLAFMLTAGNPAMRTARSQFSCNFFACGGYRVVDNPGFASAGEGVKAALEAGAKIIVVCSSDEEYETLAPEVLEQAGGKAIVVVAGNPPCADKLKEAGIEHFISIRSDLVESIIKFHRLTGIIS
ncbi:MAG: methylmalonyl-CoA mutase family protein [Bacteroidales bacterium]